MVGWRNIKNEDYAGQSFGYSKGDTAVGTTNGAGPHNVQIFVLSPELVVLHAMPGFWHPEDLARELRFAKVLHRLWRDDTRTRAQKDEMFRRLQAAEPRSHPAVTYARSAWQPFDVRYEMTRAARGETRDTVLARRASGLPQMKPLNVLVHERMASRPFVPFAEFDIAEFIDYGRPFYDNNAGVDGRGRRFASWWRNKKTRG